ncbi:hypothetical protein BCR33DRAFT_187821 [Rhizoclosmatium globosum]|uniref:Uncharacterized protein n=1 Tax=Rhizoclosmatium globosum TaxID=329046 RepID=A0A1Y2D3J2_9FUNG|nr:hypothetical protein BCR33DRAFT_187821 [Rhizoclosmatium globosum]|eukprot:ORY53125.1 hypothetical protein BCR33DRAFT_187821 [Rhizoclosmatium globosum]
MVAQLRRFWIWSSQQGNSTQKSKLKKFNIFGKLAPKGAVKISNVWLSPDMRKTSANGCAFPWFFAIYVLTICLLFLDLLSLQMLPYRGYHFQFQFPSCFMLAKWTFPVAIINPPV